MSDYCPLKLKKCLIIGVESGVINWVDVNITVEDKEIKEEPLEVKQEIEESGDSARRGEKRILPWSHSSETAPEDKKIQLSQVEVRIEDKSKSDKAISALQRKRSMSTLV